MNTPKLLLTAFSVAAMMSAQSMAVERTLKICVADDAPAEIKAAASTILAGVQTNPLLSVLAEGKPPTSLTDTKALADGSINARAYSHLVVVGLPTDPIIAQAWQRNARVEEDGFYIFGFGELRGILGYIESDRNPFLHSAAVASTPFETEIVTITGDTPEGVALAVDAFLKQGLINGVVAAPGWKRPITTLLDHDPLSPDFTPDLPPRTAKRIGLTQAGEDEYSGVLADTGLMPVAIWRAKVFVPGCWDGPGAANSIAQYLTGLQRRAYGNTLWCAKFDSSENAALAAPKIAVAAGLSKKGGIWAGTGTPKDAPIFPLELWQEKSWVIMSSVPKPQPQPPATIKDLTAIFYSLGFEDGKTHFPPPGKNPPTETVDTISVANASGITPAGAGGGKVLQWDRTEGGTTSPSHENDLMLSNLNLAIPAKSTSLVFYFKTALGRTTLAKQGSKIMMKVYLTNPDGTKTDFSTPIHQFSESDKTAFAAVIGMTPNFTAGTYNAVDSIAIKYWIGTAGGGALKNQSQTIYLNSLGISGQ